MRPTSAALATALLVGALCACDSLTAPDTDLLHVQAVPPTLLIRNLVQVPVYTFIVDRDLLALIDWVPCTNPETCTRLTPGEHTIPYSEISGYNENSREVAVYHWRLIAKPGGGFEPDSVRQLIVALP